MTSRIASSLAIHANSHWFNVTHRQSRLHTTSPTFPRRPLRGIRPALSAKRAFFLQNNATHNFLATVKQPVSSPFISSCHFRSGSDAGHSQSHSTGGGNYCNGAVCCQRTCLTASFKISEWQKFSFSTFNNCFWSSACKKKRPPHLHRKKKKCWFWAVKFSLLLENFRPAALHSIQPNQFTLLVLAHIET